MPGEHDVTMPSGGGEIGQMVWSCSQTGGCGGCQRLCYVSRQGYSIRGILLGESSFSPPDDAMTVSYTLTSGERPAGDIIIVWEFTYTADSGLVDNVKGVINMHKVVSWVLYGRRTQM